MSPHTKSHAPAQIVTIVAVMFTLFISGTLSAQESSFVVHLERGEKVDKILAALDEETKIEFIETPLQDVIEYLEDLHGIEIELDSNSLKQAGIGSDAVVTKELNGISLRSALHFVLKDLKLAYAIENEVLLITTAEQAGRHAELRVYNVAGLLDTNETADHLSKTLEDVLRRQLPSSRNIDDDPFGRRRDSNKGPRQISVYRQLLLVRDSLDGHDELVRLLAAMRKGLDISKPVTTEEPAKE